MGLQSMFQIFALTAGEMPQMGWELSGWGKYQGRISPRGCPTLISSQKFGVGNPAPGPWAEVGLVGCNPRKMQKKNLGHAPYVPTSAGGRG